MQHSLEIFHYGNGTLKVFTKKRSDFRAPRNTKKRRSGREKLNKKNTIEFEKSNGTIPHSVVNLIFYKTVPTKITEKSDKK